jgi:hypothetical protein
MSREFVIEVVSATFEQMLEQIKAAEKIGLDYELTKYTHFIQDEVEIKFNVKLYVPSRSSK